MDSLTIRASLRSMHLDESRENRHQNLDAVRLGLGAITDELKQLDSISLQDVLGLAGRIKRRRKADRPDLIRLSRAFLQDAANITTFINTPGALNVLIKELTGNEMDVQILSCECLCNISLGPVFACNKVALAASSYLITFLDSTCPRLQVGNLNEICINSNAYPFCRLLLFGQSRISPLQIVQKLLKF